MGEGGSRRGGEIYLQSLKTALIGFAFLTFAKRKLGI